MMSCVRREDAFTLIELMAVVAIIGILAAVAMVSYQRFTEKAKAVEAEVALAEVNRLEMMYRMNHGSYSNDLGAIGFSLASALKYHKVEVRLQNAGTAFQALALPLGGSGKQLALVLTRTPDGQTGFMRADPATLPAASGGDSSGIGDLGASSMGRGGAASGAGGDQTKPGCKEGGDATVASDGLLDMNFCLDRPTSSRR